MMWTLSERNSKLLSITWNAKTWRNQQQLSQLFCLSKILISVEKRYWFIQLEIAAIVWVIKKLHHMFCASKSLTIIWIDHSITTVIIKQTKLSIENIDKLNLRLIKVVMYLSQFDINVRRKSERDHVIFDVLFRLSSWNDDEEKITENLNSNILNNIDAYAYVETLIEMSSKFQKRLINVYNIDKKWSALYAMLSILKISRAQTTRREIISVTTNTRKISEQTQIEKNPSTQRCLSENFTHDEIEFEQRNDLVYHLNRVTFKARLCISKSLMQNIFKITHDDLAHADFHRTYIMIFEILYIRRLAHHLRQYIDYCSQCLLNQTKRHKSYESFVFISSVKTSFHTIVMNFVLALSQSDKEKFDILLTMTNKFFKTKLLISEFNIWKAHNWTISLWKYLQLCNWKLSREIISNKDAKFRFDLWKSLFKVVEIDLLISIIYHSQTDNQSERINQTIETTLRYLLTSDSNLSWHEALSALQHTFMNTIIFTRYSSN
jgi:hypothetical protein